MEKSARFDALATELVADSLGGAFAWRPASNDAHALLEVFGVEAWDRAPAYAREGFSVDGHVVLDVGAHIGCFSRWALANGATSVVAYEPEPSNIELLKRNLAGEAAAVVREAAVVAAGGGSEDLVLGKDWQGVHNTWRHSLRDVSHYRGADLETVKVDAVSFDDALLAAEAAAGKAVTFVKMDCEGTELEILDACERWRGVTHLVVEYSFTKRRSLDAFRRTADQLSKHFASVECPQLPDDPTVAEWAGHRDALLFCTI